jgi:hypothetical protein
MAETETLENRVSSEERKAKQVPNRRTACLQLNRKRGKLTMVGYACCRNKDGKASVLPGWAVGVVLVSAEFESSSPNRKPVVLLLSSRPMSAKYVRDRVTGIEYRLRLEKVFG